MSERRSKISVEDMSSSLTALYIVQLLHAILHLIGFFCTGIRLFISFLTLFDDLSILLSVFALVLCIIALLGVTLSTYDRNKRIQQSSYALLSLHIFLTVVLLIFHIACISVSTVLSYDSDSSSVIQHRANRTAQASRDGRGMMEAIPDYFILDPESALYGVYMPDRLLKAYGIWIGCEALSILLSSLLIPLNYRVKRERFIKQKYIELE